MSKYEVYNINNEEIKEYSFEELKLHYIDLLAREIDNIVTLIRDNNLNKFIDEASEYTKAIIKIINAKNFDEFKDVINELYILKKVDHNTYDRRIREKTRV